MSRNKKSRYNVSDILHVVFIITLITCLVIAAVTEVYLWTHVKGSFFMGGKNGYSIFETVYLFKKAPKAMITGYISAAGAAGSLIGILITR